MSIFDENWVKSAIFAGFAGLHPLYRRAGPLTPRNLRGVTPGPGVREYGNASAPSDIVDNVSLVNVHVPVCRLYCASKTILSTGI